MDKKNLLKFLFLLLSTQYAIGNSGKICVTSFGARPDDGKDDTRALRAAAAYCRKNPGTTLSFPAGTYVLRDQEAIRLEQDVMNGKYGENPEKIIYTPYYPYVKGLDFSGAQDLCIQADGALLMCDGWMEPLSLTDCKNVTINGLTIDYKRQPYSAGTVITIEADYFDVQFPQERIMTESMPYCRQTFWMKDKHRLYPEPIYFPKKEILTDNVVRFHHKIPYELLGSISGVLHSFHFRPAILILDSDNITLNEVTIHSQPGMGIVGFDSKNITLNQLAIIPAPGKYFSTNTDATHFACCEGLLRFDGCRFQGQGDDATNVHGYYQTITQAEKNKATLEVKAVTYTHAQVLDAPRTGDILELVEIKTLKPVKEYEVKKVVRNEHAFNCEVTLSEDLPIDYDRYYLMNITKLPHLEFANSIVNSHLARGVLVKTRNVLLTDNIFRHCTGTAIHIGAESGWHEGSHAHNVRIFNNTIIGCGSGAGGQGGASGIAVIIEANDTKNSYLHKNIQIKNNTIIGEGNSCGIYIGNAEDVFLEQNNIENCQKKILINSATNVQVNEVQ